MNDEKTCCCTNSRGGGFFRTIFQIAILYIVLVFGSGTLMHTGHPVAVEVGKLIQTVTFVQPSIGWAERRGLDALAGGLRVLSNGVDVSGVVA